MQLYIVTPRVQPFLGAFFKNQFVLVDDTLSIDREWDWATRLTELFYLFGLMELVFDLDHTPSSCLGNSNDSFCNSGAGRIC